MENETKGMSAQEAIQMMERCEHEIVQLKAENHRLRPKAEAYDNIATILRLLPQPTQGYGEDLVWVLRKRIQELQPKPVNDALPR